MTISVMGCSTWQAGVHLQEVELLLGVDEELDGSGIAVVGGLADLDSDFAHAAAHIGIDKGAGRLFENFLMAALDTALTFGEIDDVAVSVAEDLHLDVAWIFYELLDVNFGIAKGALGLALRGFESRGEFAGIR